MQVPFIGKRTPPDFSGVTRYQQLHRYGLAYGLARDVDVVDVASGEGYGAAYLAMVARSVVAVDTDHRSVRRAAARYTGMNLTFRAGSFANLPLPDQSVDLVVAFDTLEHVEDPNALMREIGRVLRSEGSLIISAPNRLLPDGGDAQDDHFGVRTMYFDELRDLCGRWFPHSRLYGQRVVAASAIHPLRGVATKARCISPVTNGGEQGLPALPVPASFIAVCSRGGRAALAELESIFVDPRDDVLERIASFRPERPAEVVRLESEPAAHRNPGVLPGEASALRGLLATVFGHDDAVPPDLSEAVGLAEKLVQDSFDERERATVRLAEVQAEVTDNFARLTAAEKLAERFAGDVERLRAENEELRAQHETLRFENDAFRTDAARAEMRSAELAAALAAQRRTATDAAQLERELAGARSEHSRLAREIIRLREVAEERESERRRDHELRSSQSARTAALEAEHSDMRVQLLRVLGERDYLSATLGAILNSRSWRITKPLRLMRRAFRDR